MPVNFIINARLLKLSRNLKRIIMKKCLLTLSLILLILANNAIAHHGTSAHFDHSKDIMVEGVVTEMKFVNPHSYLYFNAVGDNGESVPWRCELVESGTLRRAGLTKEILAPGTPVRVHGKPARREATACYLESMTLTDGRTISHRGQIAEGGEGFTPNAELKSLDANYAADETEILAYGGTEAKNRKIVDVPIEGMFGHWADGTRRALNPVQGGGQGRAMGAGMGGGMAMGMAGQAMGGNQQGGNAEQSTAAQYNEAGKAIAERYDPRYDNPALQCSASVIFGMSHHALANEFVQLSEKEVRWTYGFMDMVRTIHIDGEFPAEITPSTKGYSIGKWDNETLIVTTKGFLPGVLFAAGGDFGSNSSTVNSDQLVVVEEFTHDEATDKLNLKWTATDEGYWTASMQGEKSLTRSTPYEVYGCEELGGKNNLRENGETLFDTGNKVSSKSSAGKGIAPKAVSLAANTTAAVTSPQAAEVAPAAPAEKSSSLIYILGGGLLLALGVFFITANGRSKKKES